MPALPPAAVVVVVVIVARVAFSTHCMCTGNTAAKVRKRGQRSPAAETRVTRSCGAVLLLCRSFSLRLSPFLPFLHRLLPSPVPPLPVHNCVLLSRYAIACRSTNGGHRNPRDKPRRYNARDTGLGLPFHRERRDLSVRREVSISRSLVRMPFPRHCRRRNAVFANLGAVAPGKIIYQWFSKLLQGTSSRVSLSSSDFLPIGPLRLLCDFCT